MLLLYLPTAGTATAVFTRHWYSCCYIYSVLIQLLLYQPAAGKAAAVFTRRWYSCCRIYPLLVQLLRYLPGAGRAAAMFTRRWYSCCCIYPSLVELVERLEQVGLVWLPAARHEALRARLCLVHLRRRHERVKAAKNSILEPRVLGIKKLPLCLPFGFP